MAKEPDATVRYAHAEAKLFRRAKRFNDGQEEMSCDQIIVQHFTGNEENVVIYESGGKRRVGRVGPLMGLQSGSVALTPQTLAQPSKYSTLMTRSGYSQSTTSL